MLVILSVPKAVWCEGLLGYNVVFYVIYWAGGGERRLFYALLFMVLSVLLRLLALHTGLIPLTTPFVLSV